MIKFGKILFGLVITICLSQIVFGATYTVTKIADTADGTCDADCSLREAVVSANATVDNDTIIFSSLFNTAQTITLSGTDIIITNNGTLLIFGPGNNKLTVSGNNVSRVFTNNTGSVATISNLRVTGGTGTSTVAAGRGGGIYNNAATLTLNNLVITGNTSTNGGGTSNAGTSTINIIGCAVFNNTAPSSGGAHQNFSGNNVTNIRHSSYYNNTSGSNTVGGGAIQANGTVNITNSTFANNTANTGSGGAIFYNGTVLSVTNSTFVGNTSTLNGGAIHKSTTNLGVIRNTIISGNNGIAASPDATGAFNSEGNNIIGNVGTTTGWISSDLQNTNPILSPLGSYGGNGLSYALLSSSPAINAGQNCVTDLSCTTNNPPVAITTDQRGAPRPSGPAVDIGAFESSGGYVTVLPNARINQPYNQTISPNVGSFTYSVTGGNLPLGINVNTAGQMASVNGTPTQTGAYLFGVTISNGTNTTIVNYLVNVLTDATTATVGGTVTRANGNGLGKVIVTLIDNGGNQRTTISSSFGYYSFDNVVVGEMYQIVVNSKSYVFNPNSTFFVVTDNISNLNFMAQP